MVRMMEKDKYVFFDRSMLVETKGIRERCREEYLQKELARRFPEEKFRVAGVCINETGRYKRCQNLPAYCEVVLEVESGGFPEEIIIWSPLAWNGRFAGTGTATGGRQYMTPPDNTVRGWTVPYAVSNGFTAATADAQNVHGLKDKMLDPKTGEFRWELYENWRGRTTHHMTVFGRAVAEILHKRGVAYAYMNGGSGGGRQSMVEAQEYPDDYDGIWASCPAVNWNRFLPQGLWAIAVMNSLKHVLSPGKIRFFTESVWKSAGGREAYFHREERTMFDPFSLTGERVGKEQITDEDALVMQKIWEGPKNAAGERLWFGFRPGAVFWNVGIPVGAFYYSLIRKRPKPFFLSVSYLRWVTGSRKQKFDDITMEEYEDLFAASSEKFAGAAADKADLSAFADHGGRLIIDHGLNDPLIPVDGTIDYFSRLYNQMGPEKAEEFCRLYLTPGDGHGNCWCEGPGLTESAGLQALMQWVEEGRAPVALRAVRVDKKSGRLLEETLREPVKEQSA